MSTERHQRLEHQLTQRLATVILNGEVKDPRVSRMAVIAGVKLSPDQKHATVRVGGYLSENDLAATVEGLNSAGGFLQGVIARSVRMKWTPRLRFVEDRSIAEGFEVTQKLKELGF